MIGLYPVKENNLDDIIFINASKNANRAVVQFVEHHLDFILDDRELLVPKVHMVNTRAWTQDIGNHVIAHQIQNLRYFILLLNAKMPNPLAIILKLYCFKQFCVHKVFQEKC